MKRLLIIMNAGKVSVTMAFLVILFLIGSYGCATAPPPRMENNIYINPKYQFSIEAPEGWEPTNIIPTWATGEVGLTFSGLGIPEVQIIFINNETKGLIIIRSEKTIFDFRIVSWKGQRNRMRKLLEKNKAEFEKNPDFRNYSYVLMYEKPRLETRACITGAFSFQYCPVIIGYEAFEYEINFRKMRVKKTLLMYTCDKDDTCFVGINLVSDDKTFDRNHQVYDQVVESFNCGLLRQ